MKIHLASYQPDRLGGGWSFMRNFVKGFALYSYEEADIYFIPSASVVERAEVQQAKADGKKIVLRVDNAIRNSRNRNTGMSRLYDFAQLADLVIYQSNWARDFLYPFLQKDGVVILNGVDTEVFKPSSIQPEDDTYLYVRSSNDEGKQWIMAWYWFANNPGKLDIVGKFSKENLEYNFDFFNNESYKFYGQQPDMRPFYQRNKNFLYTYLNDACSNTLLEALASGMNIIDIYGMLNTGGAPEIMACKDISLNRMYKEYEEVLNGLFL